MHILCVIWKQVLDMLKCSVHTIKCECVVHNDTMNSISTYSTCMEPMQYLY